MAERILIVGASGRAAAFSALRAGLTPAVIDLFGDEDLRAVAESHVISERNYPDGLIEMARALRPMPWMYTGALENRPDIVGGIAAERALIGNGPEVLAKVRNPFVLAAALAEAGIQCPRVSHDSAPGERWLRKLDCRGGHYFQEYLDGESRAAIYRDGRLLGVTRQLVGEPWLHAPRWQYCGSVGPLILTESEKRRWKSLGEFLGTWAGVQGIFGVDAIVRDGTPWPVEVNPRYTASVEVIEYARLVGRSLAKAVYYAPHSVIICDNEPWANWQRARNEQAPEFADIPRAGSVIARGRPVLTIFGRNETELRAKAAMVDARFAHDAEPVGSQRL